jgi:hypothetical protein
MRKGADLPELTHGAKAAKRVHASKLASQAARRVVAEKVDAYLATLRKAVELPGELNKAGTGIITTIDGWLDQVNELFRHGVRAADRVS